MKMWGRNNENITWNSHGYKHFPPKGKKWLDIIKSTKTGPAKYIPGINIEKLEKEVWNTGRSVTNGKNWKVKEFDYVVGASDGKESYRIRVEESAGYIHGHPITKEEYLKLIK